MLWCVPMVERQVKEGGFFWWTRSGYSEMARNPMFVGVSKALESALEALKAQNEVIDHLAIQLAIPAHLVRSSAPAEVVRSMSVKEACIVETVRNSIAEGAVSKLGWDAPVVIHSRVDGLETVGMGVRAIGGLRDVAVAILGVVSQTESGPALVRTNFHGTVDTAGIGVGGKGGGMDMHVVPALVSLVVRVSGRNKIGKAAGTVGLVARCARRRGGVDNNGHGCLRSPAVSDGDENSAVGHFSVCYFHGE
ncbi:hypothetical protein B0H13DRAFT_2059077 [Mycena leptocephala]|nr:hypothetical protein B0H13DRAFT_2059077 [Mycena leptocephala]